MTDPIVVRPQITVVRVSARPAAIIRPVIDQTEVIQKTEPLTIVRITERTQTVEAGIQGPAGRDGADGVSGSGALKVAFAFGDASPAQIALLAAGSTVFTAQIVIQIPLNGIGARLQLGDAQMSDRLISASQVDAGFAAEYETNPGQTYPDATEILLTITPGEGCTQGAGYILLEAA
ncbi:MAG TPA: hypothetical protein V6C57_22730 [Coleofasciculaceae cyanobacterium]